MYSLSSYLGEILLLNSFINGLKRIGYDFIVIYFFTFYYYRFKYSLRHENSELKVIHNTF